MNILLLALDINLSVTRGDAVHTIEIARSLAQRGHRVDLVVASNGVNSRNSRLVVHLRSPGSDLSVVASCARIGRDAGTDVIYERRLSPKIAFGVSRLLGLPFVVEVNGIEEEASIQGRGAQSGWRPIKARIRRAMYHSAARVVAVSDRLASIIAARTGLPMNRITVVPNGVDTEGFVPTNAVEARELLGLEVGSWIIYVGNLVPWQGLDTALRAFPIILERCPRARFAIVGDGVLREPLEEMASTLGVRDRLLMKGPVPHEAIPTWIGAANVCLAPFARARNETIGLSPLKVYEYMSCGRPVVASDIPGVTELLTRSGGGLVVPPENPEALAAAIVQLLSSEREAGEMGERGRRFAVEHCSWSKTAERVERVL